MRTIILFAIIFLVLLNYAASAQVEYRNGGWYYSGNEFKVLESQSFYNNLGCSLMDVFDDEKNYKCISLDKKDWFDYTMNSKNKTINPDDFIITSSTKYFGGTFKVGSTKADFARHLWPDKPNIKLIKNYFSLQISGTPYVILFYFRKNRCYKISMLLTLRDP